MTEADSVHSTPPLNSPSIPDGNPTLEPRAESVDSFSPVTTEGQRETGKRTSESRRPVTSQSNVVTFPGNRPATNVRELRNPLFQFPTEDVVEPTLRDARRQCRRQSESQTETGKNAKLRRQRREAW